MLIKYRTKTISELKSCWDKTCPKCNFVKPARTHHCSICQTCVFNMDHHCPWINNCVGLENYRYFLLFIFYLLVGVSYFLISIISIWNHYSYLDNKMMMQFLVILDSALILLMLLFNVWNWFMACSGLSTLEFMGQATGYKKNGFDYSFSRVRDNLFKVFGTKSYFAILSPSLRIGPFTGIEWSFQMMDLGFDEHGELL